MLNVYVLGCVNCHSSIRLLKEKSIKYCIIKDEKLVSEVVSNHTGLVPTFGYDGKFYNEFELKEMLRNGETFEPKVIEEKKEIIKPSEIKINKSKITEVIKED